MKRYSNRSNFSTLSEINVTPLLDLAFVLLIIFMITTPLLVLVHMGVLIALLRWVGSSKIAGAQEITWLNTGSEPTATADVAKAEEAPTPESERKASPPGENQPASTPAKSEIQIPAAIP